MNRSHRTLLVAAALLGLASIAQAQTTEPPPTPAPTTPPTAPIPTIASPVMRLAPPLAAGEQPRLVVALPSTGGYVLESSTDMKTWSNDSASVPATRVAFMALEKAPGEQRRYYRVRN